MTHLNRIQTELYKACALLTAAEDLTNKGIIVSIDSLKSITTDICSLIKEEGYSRCLIFKPILSGLTEHMDRLYALIEKQMQNNKER